jgi:Fic family protein
MEPYIPESLPPEGIDWASLAGLIGRANRALGGYDGVVQSIVNPNILLAPLEAREAQLSSRIEGTRASLEDVLEFGTEEVAEISTAHEAELEEINNYRRAMRQALTDLSSKPLGINLLRALHKTLLSGVRGRNKEPGEIRRRQNYISGAGTSIEQASFIPPEPMLVMDGLTDWENYLHSDERDPIVQVAILKGQFELIHPFLDGNGRIGRMLVPLILYRKGVIGSPNFYISASLERDRDTYYDRLIDLSRNHDWNGWIGLSSTASI